MVDDKLDHPGAEQSNAFGLGQLDPAVSAEVERHVASCTVCCQTLWTLPDDQLVKLLRQAFPKPPDAGADTLALPSPASAPAAPQVPPELAEHPRYRIVEVLGVGGMGVVYKAEHRLMERSVALKVINRDLTDKPNAVERFRREVKAAAQLNHPNIVHAYDADQAGDSHFLVMEFVEGTTLACLVEQQGSLPAIRACDYVRQAALGLQRAHEHGMVHRDIKPHNLMRTPQGQIKILDFGLARLVSEVAPSLSLAAEDAAPMDAVCQSLTQLGMVMGTADYMAPEQATDAHAADIRADIYSLGCTLYYLLTGQAPFPEGTVLDKLRAHGQRTPRPLSDFRAKVPAKLARVLQRMMAKDPARRYQTPAEVANALLPFTDVQQRRRWPWLWRLTAAVLMAGVVSAAIPMILVRTDRGDFVIETDDENIAVQLDKAGVKIHDRASNREYLLKVGKHRLPTGEYDIDVSELPGGIEMTTDTFQLKRGETLRVRASAREPAKLVQRADSMRKERVLKAFGADDKPLTQDDVTADQGGWRIEAKEGRTVRLYEVANPGVEDCRVTYQAKLKTEKLKGKAYLEMWCHFPDQGEFFSKGLMNPVSGTTDWASYETPFFLKKGQKPDRIKLNVVLEGSGTLWIKNIKLRKAPLPAGERN